MRLSSFNPRARVGRDLPIRYSIRFHPCFNPRARVGRDVSSGSVQSSRGSFNPRARVGRDTASQTLWSWLMGFQSTRPRGARQSISYLLDRFQQVSIHAPAWGATWEDLGAYFDCDVSIHAPAWGATCHSVLQFPYL